MKALINKATIIQAVSRAFNDFMSPRILALMIVPWILGLILALGIGYVLWVPVFSKFLGLLQQYATWLQSLSEFFSAYVSIDFSFWVTVLIVIIQCIILLPLIFIFPFLIATTFATPIALKVAEKHYPHIKRSGNDLLWPSLKNSLKATLYLLIWWLLTLPLSFIPIVNLFIPVLILTFFNKRIFTYDILRPLLSEAQYHFFLSKEAITWYLAALILSVLSMVPIINLIVPVFGGLLYAHLALLKISHAQKNLVGL